MPPLPPSLSFYSSLFLSDYKQKEKSLEDLPRILFLKGAVIQFSQFSRSVMSDSLRPHESQHTRPPCPSPTPGVHSDSRPSSQRCHPAISSSVIPFSSCTQSLPASKSFPMSQLIPYLPLIQTPLVFCLPGINIQ